MIEFLMHHTVWVKKNLSGTHFIYILGLTQYNNIPNLLNLWTSLTFLNFWPLKWSFIGFIPYFSLGAQITHPPLIFIFFLNVGELFLPISSPLSVVCGRMLKILSHSFDEIQWIFHIWFRILLFWGGSTNNRNVVENLCYVI